MFRSMLTHLCQLVTAIASLQLVEQGLLKLDEPISNVLSEFKETTVLTAYDEATNTPTTEPAPRAPTLRELLTHSSGTVYALMHPLLGAYLTHHLGRPASATNNNITYSHSHPSAFAPGTSWSYSPGLEWAGIAVAQVSQSDNLSDYIQRHIFEPLGMNSSTFHPTRRPEIMARMTHMPMRDPTSGKLVPNTSGMWPIIDPEDDFGGAGMYSCASDYIKLLTSLLLNDGKVLKPETVDNVLFRPCLSAESKAAMNGMFAGPFASFLAPGYPIASDAVVYDYAPGGAVLVNGAKGLAGKGTLYWAGLPNSDWVSSSTRRVPMLLAGPPRSWALGRATRTENWLEDEILTMRTTVYRPRERHCWDLRHAFAPAG